MKRIIWHPEASNDFRKILEYCRDNFGRNTAKGGRERILKSISLLSSYPKLGLIEPFLIAQGTLEYRSLILKKTKVIYTVHDDYIYIHMIWNTLRNPESMSNEVGKR